MALLRALKRTCELLESSVDSDWTPWTAAEIRSDLVEIIEAVQSGASYDKSKLQLLFLPTGPVQETSMANGWSDEMLELAQIIDQHTEKKPWWQFWRR